MTRSNSLTSLYIRNLIFGVEDGLVSTVGFLSGIAVAGVPRSTLIVTGFVLIFVEAFSMGVGSFLSEDTIEEAEQQSRAEQRSLAGAIVMFGSYIISGAIPLLPYLFSYSPGTLVVSILLSFIALLGLGIVSARLYKKPLLRGGLRMLLLGGAAIIVGVAIGRIFPLV